MAEIEGLSLSAARDGPCARRLHLVIMERLARRGLRARGAVGILSRFVSERSRANQAKTCLRSSARGKEGREP